MKPRSEFSTVVLFMLVSALQETVSLQTMLCDFETEGDFCEGWRGESPVNTIGIISNASSSLGIPHSPTRNGNNKFLHISAANKSQSGMYVLRSLSFVLNRTHILEFDYLLRASGNTNLKVFADINAIPGNFISFYQTDTNNNWKKAEAVIEVIQPQSTIEIEIRGDIQNNDDFVAIDNLRIIEPSSRLILSAVVEPTSSTASIPTSSSLRSVSIDPDWSDVDNDSQVPEPASSQAKHTYSTLLILLCICLSILGSTLGMTLLVRQCYIHKEQLFAMGSERSSYN